MFSFDTRVQETYSETNRTIIVIDALVPLQLNKPLLLYFTPRKKIHFS